MGQFTDLTGRVFGRLTVTSLNRRGAGVYWNCHCSCGNETAIRSTYLTATKQPTQSCGCIQKEIMQAIRTTHGLCGTYIYRAHAQIIQRCTNPNNPAYLNYGARGITFHREWHDSADAFNAAMGERPSDKHSIDRIDNDKGYEPGNVRWATRTEQARNRRSNKLLTVGDKTVSLSEWAEISGRPRHLISDRLTRGLSHHDAVYGE